MKYCRNCGKKISEKAHSCPKCGHPKNEKIKDKGVAIILAIFFSFWTWLYTYKKDAWKFWVGLGISIVLSLPTYLLAPIGIWIWAIVDTIIKDSEFYNKYH